MTKEMTVDLTKLKAGDIKKYVDMMRVFTDKSVDNCPEELKLELFKEASFAAILEISKQLTAIEEKLNALQESLQPVIKRCEV